MNWTEFRLIFLEKYVSMTYRNQMKMEFLKLEQGTDSVSVYVQKFDTHSRYAPEYVSNETDRVWKFSEGLKKHFRPYIVTSGVKTYAEVVEQALALERLEQGSGQAGEAPRDQNRQGSGQGSGQFRKSGGSNQNRDPTSQNRPQFSGNNKRKFEGGRSQGQVQPQSSNTERTQASGMNRGCFKCGQSGHMQGQC
ncbi:retrotransposon gag family protein, partial [Klebsiella pneumoniae]|uniref:retrotransposon gag family protein n=1 Tax=Klebsiella pneumoniae TaxID=573 RepID=UPI001D0E9A67